MSMDVPQAVTLGEVIAKSYYIVVVERSEPFDRIEMVDFDDQRCPPFRKVIYRFRVLEELVNKGGVPLKEEIEVLPASSSEDMYAHRRRHLEGESISLYRPEYEGADFDSRRLILFLNQNFELVADGAYEKPENKVTIIRKCRGGDSNSRTD